MGYPMPEQDNEKRLPDHGKVLLRDARAEDVPHILEIYNDAVLNTTATFELNPQTLEQRMKWFSNHGGRFPLVVAELEDKIVGYCSLSGFRGSSGYATTAESSVYVHKDFRKRGIASAMMSEILNRARQLKYHAIVACIAGGNDTSVKFHEKFGFKFSGRLKEVGLKFGKWQDDVFYVLLILESGMSVLKVCRHLISFVFGEKVISQ